MVWCNGNKIKAICISGVKINHFTFMFTVFSIFSPKTDTIFPSYETSKNWYLI